MRRYKLFFLEPDDGQRGRPRRRLELECEDDAEAVEMARAHADGSMMELWRDGVFVKGWSARPLR